MTSIARLKDRARKHEQKEDWQAAIRAYQQVLQAEEGTDEADLELGLYNRIGDLFLRIGQIEKAVTYYETAADKYAESGFLNNAIALCNKALRHRPDRAPLYLKLSYLCSAQGFRTDARRWILEYAQGRVDAGAVDQAVEGLTSIDKLARDPEVRESFARYLAEHDHLDQSVLQLREAYRLHQDAGDEESAARIAEEARRLDPSVELAPEAAPTATDVHLPEESETDRAEETPGVEPGGDEATGLEGLESHHDAPAGPEETEVAGLEGLETTGAETPTGPADVGRLPGLEPTGAEEPAPSAPPEDQELEDEEEPEPLPLLDTGYEDEPDEEPEPLPLLDSGYESPGGAVEEAGAPSMEEPATAEGEGVAEDEDVEPVEATEGMETPRDEAGLEVGEPSTGAGIGAQDEVESIEEIDAPMFEGELDLDISGVDRWSGEGSPAEGLDLDLSALGGSGGESGSTGDLDIEAVLQRSRELVSRGLGSEALRELRLLSGTDAEPAVFRHALSVVNEVLRRNADDVAALQRRVEYAARTGERELLLEAYLDLADALARQGAETKAQAMYGRVLDLDPANAAAREALGMPAGGEEETVDLDAVLRETEGPEQEAGEAVEAAPGAAADEPRDHYDLGLAFKEMGLVDEAIAEFKTALRQGVERLKVYEELGQCYMEKQEYAIALKVLRRGLQVVPAQEDELLGVYYHLGQCHEALGERDDARDAYEKVLSIDDSFADVPQRMAEL